LAAQHAPLRAPEPDSPRFYILDAADEVMHAGLFARVAATLPHGVRLGDWNDAAMLIADLAAEVERRQKLPRASAALGAAARGAAPSTPPPLYLFVHGLQRFRELRRQEDDFSFSRSEDQGPSPAKQLVTMLTEGPPLGIHTLIWCDSYNNLT